MEDVRAVAMDEDAGAIEVVKGIAADVVALVDKQNPFSHRARKPFREHAAGKACPNDEVVIGISPD